MSFSLALLTTLKSFLCLYFIFGIPVVWGFFSYKKDTEEVSGLLFFLICRERDDLMDALVSVRQNMKEMQQRESNACKQVEHAVQMAEEANFEKTKVNPS